VEEVINKKYTQFLNLIKRIVRAEEELKNSRDQMKKMFEMIDRSLTQWLNLYGFTSLAILMAIF
jgi:molecular chaperone GrpE (heat shock protein)